jgi:hypothetical protein
MLQDDPDLHSARLLDYGTTSPLFYYVALAAASRGQLTKEELLDASRLDSELARIFAPQPIIRPQRCRMETIARQERRRYWDNWVIEVSPLVRNIYADRDEYGMFARGSLGGGQSGVYYWFALRDDGSPARIVRLDVSESP